MKTLIMKQFSITLFVMLCISAISAKAQESKVLIDNDKIKVTEYISQPGKDVCGTGKHSHVDHATILLSDAKVKTINADGVTEIETYSAAKHLYIVSKNGKTDKIPIDGTFWVPGASHSVTNIGNKPLRFYIVETKN